MTTRHQDQPELVSVLRAADCFGALEEPALRDLASDMSLISLSDGDTLVRQGEWPDHLYIVVEGGLALTGIERRGVSRVLPDLTAGNLVGEMNLFFSAPAPATVRARGPVLLAALSPAAIDRFSHRHPLAALELMEALGPRLRRHRLWIALHLSGMFQHVESAALSDLESEFELVALYGGEVLFRQNDHGDALYVVVSGRLRVVTTGEDGAEVRLAELPAGETVGEMALISGAPRSATVYAIRDTHLARLSRAAVERVLARHPKPMLALLTGNLVARLRKMSNSGRRDAGSPRLPSCPPHTMFRCRSSARS